MADVACVEVHDVAPPTWRLCQRLVDWLDARGVGPLALLVVPYYHRVSPTIGDRPFLDWLADRRARGDELVLHGYVHLDESPAGGGVAMRLARRWLTAGEGEFAALGHDEAARRLQAGLELFRDAGWPRPGFVPPAWLAGAQARSAIDDSGVAYLAMRNTVRVVPGNRCVRAPAVAWSMRSRPRRLTSLAVNALRALQRPSNLRVALHPADALRSDGFARVRHQTHRLIAGRRLVTLAELVGAPR